MKKYTFTTDALTVCGPHFPAGKSFPVRYELQDRAEMKRGQILPTIHAFVTLDDGKEIKIDIPGDDEYNAEVDKQLRNNRVMKGARI